MTERDATIHAACALSAKRYVFRRRVNFFVVDQSLRRITVGDCLTSKFFKSGWLSHCLFLRGPRPSLVGRAKLAHELIVSDGINALADSRGCLGSRCRPLCEHALIVGRHYLNELSQRQRPVVHETLGYRRIGVEIMFLYQFV